MDYIIKRSKRKNVSIYITKEAKVEVHAPLKLSKSVIDELVASKEEWIQEHLVLMNDRVEKRETFRLGNGSSVFILGIEYPIHDTNGDKAVLCDDKVYLPIGDFSVRKEAMINLYKKLAHEIIPKVVKKHAHIMNVTPKSVKITSAKTRWGSCSGDNRLNFSWFLMMAPESAIDYVVIHELSHTIEHNHSNKFWAIVENFCPDFQKEKQSLKILTKRLISENW